VSGSPRASGQWRSARPRIRVAVIATMCGGLVWVGAGAAVAHVDITPVALAAPVSGAAAETGVKRAPTVPPLATGSGALAGTDGQSTAAEEASASAPISAGDPLRSNGLDSPLCRDATGELAGAAARNCRSSGFEGAQAPSGDYGLDVHISTGLTHIAIGSETSVIVEDILQLWWTTLVAVVRGVIVVLDWCYTLDLLNSPAMSGLARGLRQTQATFTRPWLEIVLAIAAMGALYHGLIRRRVAQTLGEALLMMAMMAGGLWVIMNPTGTIGALGAWANEASLGTLAAVRAGSADHPYRTLAESDRQLFGAVIDAPWCFMEFGDVGWCEAPVEPRLRKAALKLAAQAKAGGEGDGGGGAAGLPRKALEGSLNLVERLMGAGEEPEALHVSRQSAALLRAANTNGELFLALPANGPARNSLSDDQSLYSVLCDGGEGSCDGPTASEAEFRTSSGTWSRGIGLTLVAFGVLGMLLLLGFIGWRLLHAAFMSLVYLLLTPAAVLAPAFGENGRAAFRTWTMRLLAAVTSKLIYSFLLGAVLTVERVLVEVRIFGWLTQWLLLASLWWMAFWHRHKALDFAHGERGKQHHSIFHRAHQALGASRQTLDNLSRAKRTLARPAPSVERRRGRLTRAGGERAREMADTQVARSLASEQAQARATAEAGPRLQARLSEMRARLARVQGAREHATAAGDTRGAARLGVREQRIAGAIAREEGALARARRTVADGENAKRRTGQSHTREQREQHARFLDAQAVLPRAGRAADDGRRRDYAALAGLASHGREEYERLDPRRQREARSRIDRELAMRRELGGAAADMAAAAGAGSPGRRDRHDAGRQLDRALGERLRSEGHHRPPRASAGERRSTGGQRLDAWKREGAAAANSHGRRRGSPVLDDAREVAARRKRQLGRDRR
jgi:hypothetical protein